MFDFFTKSRFFGRPIELYKFTYGGSAANVHLFTDAEYAVVKGSETYLPVPIERATTNNAGTLDRSSVEIRVARDNAIAEMFRVYPPNHVVTLTIYQGEAEDPDAEWKALWAGRVVACGWEGSEAKLACDPISTSLNRVGLRRNFQYMCPHVLYGPKCQVTKVPVAATVNSASGKIVTVGTAIANPSHYQGGMLEWTTPAGLYQSRTIVSAYVIDSTTVFTLNGIATGLTGGAAVSCVKGCQHTLNFCGTVHANYHNFGGDPWIPLKNPISNISPY